MFTSYRLAIYFLIAWQFHTIIPITGNGQCDYQSITNECLRTSSCTLNKSSWPSFLTDRIEDWSISSNSSVCSTPNDCWGGNTQNCNYLERQIKPIEIQNGENVTLQLLETDGSPIVMNITNVTYNEYTQCSVAYNWYQTYDILSGNGSIEISSEMLSPGIHYFVSIVEDNIYHCEFGYRQAIISRTNMCRPPGSLNNIQQCNGHGRCNLINPNHFSIQCNCDQYSTGFYCQEYNACYNNPCRNNASCYDIQDGFNSHDYNCSCQSGYTGKNCSDIIDYCQSNPCQNNNLCNSSFNGYSCQCSIPYYGTHCQNYHDLCILLKNPCSNQVDHQCISNKDSYQCVRSAIPVSVKYHDVYPSCSFYRSNPQRLVTEMVTNIQTHCNCNFTGVDLGFTNSSITCMSESIMIYNGTMYSVNNISVEDLLCAFKRWTGPGSRLEILEPQLVVCPIEYAVRLTRTAQILIGVSAAILFILIVLVVAWFMTRGRRKTSGMASVSRQNHPKDTLFIARKNFSVTPAITELVPASSVNGDSTVHASAHDNPHQENYEMSHVNGNNTNPKITITPDHEDANKTPGSHSNKNFSNHDRLV